MRLLSRAMIFEALETLARELEALGTRRQEEIVLAGGAALVLMYLAREATRDVDVSIEPFLVPGRELKARYALEDLWESAYGS